ALATRGPPHVRGAPIPAAPPRGCQPQAPVRLLRAGDDGPAPQSHLPGAHDRRAAPQATGPVRRVRFAAGIGALSSPRRRTSMERLSIKRFSAPDEKRPFADKGYAEILAFHDGTVGRGVFEPGWRWSEHISPIAGTPSCQAAHSCYVVSGRMH